MGNLSQHSTLPHNASVCPAQAGQIVHISSRQPFGSQTEVPYLDCTTLSANSQTHTKDGSKMTLRTPKGHNAKGTHQLPNVASDNARTPKGHNAKSTHQLPMLGSDNVSLQGTPKREKRMNIVDIVDVKCGNPDRAWANPITSRLKKLGFSKLNESIC
ncbi:BnaA10g09120D [Brassica napus]|uniref:BnaA10g09120D protein n=1 Tax=Brassica napus TaxID=3708 RepID=A0A078FY39_BRANA|nr:BnaA10g09120D [Brassica napus]